MYLINFKVFILSFVIGTICMFVTAPDPKEITVYPTTDNRHLFQFRDKANNCFQLKQHIVKCSNDAEEIPLQI